MRTPDVLVLGGGGILGEAWMSAVLAGLDEAEGFDARECASYVGTSAGSIVAASLAAGLPPGARLGASPGSPEVPLEESSEPVTAWRQALGAAAEFARASGLAGVRVDRGGRSDRPPHAAAPCKPGQPIAR
jgi:NTE family protein